MFSLNNDTGSTDKSQIFNYWWNWLITLPNPELQLLHQTQVKMWNHVNQSWAAGLLIGSLITKAPVAGLLVSSWGPVVVSPLSRFRLNEQTEQGTLGGGWTGGKSASSVNQLRLSLTPDATFGCFSNSLEISLFVRTNQLLLSSLSFLHVWTQVLWMLSWTLEKVKLLKSEADMLPS